MAVSEKIETLELLSSGVSRAVDGLFICREPAIAKMVSATPEMEKAFAKPILAIPELEKAFAKPISATSKMKIAFTETVSAITKVKKAFAEMTLAIAKMILEDGFWVKNVKKTGFLRAAGTGLNAGFNGTG